MRQRLCPFRRCIFVRRMEEVIVGLRQRGNNVTLPGPEINLLQAIILCLRNPSSGKNKSARFFCPAKRAYINVVKRKIFQTPFSFSGISI